MISSKFEVQIIFFHKKYFSFPVFILIYFKFTSTLCTNFNKTSKLEFEKFLIDINLNLGFSINNFNLFCFYFYNFFN